MKRGVIKKMTTKKATRRALFTSIMALVMCLVMLVGTTFAWFTDSVTSGVNTIQAGNLDIDVEYTLDGENWNNLDKADDLFGEGLFEPGYTRVVALRFKNNGNLALKYNINMNIVEETAGINKSEQEYKLSDYLKVKTLSQEASQIGDICIGLAFSARNDALAYTTTANFKDATVLDHDLLLTPGAVGNYLIIKVYMPETVGNEANAISTEKTASIKFGLNVVATQVTYEKDSFDNTYDKTAGYPAATVGALQNALAAGGSVTVANDMDPAETLTTTKKATLDANGKTIANTTDIWEGTPIDWSLVSARGSDANLTITGNGKFEAKANDCYAVDVQDGATVTIENGTFNGNIHAVYVLEGTAYIKGGFFSVQQKYPDATKADGFVLNCYDANRANGTATIVVTGGTFVNFNPADCWAEGEHTNFVADGYTVTSETQTNGDIWYTVVAA